MKTWRNYLGYVLFPLLLLAESAFAPAADDLMPQRIGEKQRCPVCSMYPALYPKWHAQILFKDGSMVAFDSPADLLNFVHDMGKYDRKHTRKDISRIYVSNYLKGEWIDARKALFLTGSSIRGPMGPDFPAFSDRKEAQGAMAQAGGRLATFDQILSETAKDNHGSEGARRE
jgi:nitrous oxide reductase accessory protein NosL